MKKVLFALFAVASLASCSNNEVIELNREQIAFGDTFVDNATKADYSTGKTVEGFKVYGTATYTANSALKTALVFNGNNVTRNSKANGVAWDCDGTAQYWLPNATYNFAAIVDGGESGVIAMPTTIDFTVADGASNLDLLYATATVTTDENATPDPADVNANGVVAFNFNHLLSKMMFKVKNETNQKYEVTEIAVTGVAKDGEYTIGGDWSATGTTNLTFGTATVVGGTTEFASESRQIIPVEQTLGVTVTYYVLDGDDARVGNALTKTGEISAIFEANTVYVVTATLSGKTINFSLGTVNGWVGEDDTLGI